MALYRKSNGAFVRKSNGSLTPSGLGCCCDVGYWQPTECLPVFVDGTWFYPLAPFVIAIPEGFTVSSSSSTSSVPLPFPFDVDFGDVETPGYVNLHIPFGVTPTGYTGSGSSSSSIADDPYLNNRCFILGRYGRIVPDGLPIYDINDLASTIRPCFFHSEAPAWSGYDGCCDKCDNCNGGYNRPCTYEITLSGTVTGCFDGCQLLDNYGGPAGNSIFYSGTMDGTYKLSLYNTPYCSYAALIDNGSFTYDIHAYTNSCDPDYEPHFVTHGTTFFLELYQGNGEHGDLGNEKNKWYLNMKAGFPASILGIATWEFETSDNCCLIADQTSPNPKAFVRHTTDTPPYHVYTWDDVCGGTAAIHYDETPDGLELYDCATAPPFRPSSSSSSPGGSSSSSSSSPGGSSSSSSSSPGGSSSSSTPGDSSSSSGPCRLVDLWTISYNCSTHVWATATIAGTLPNDGSPQNSWIYSGESGSVCTWTQRRCSGGSAPRRPTLAECICGGGSSSSSSPHSSSSSSSPPSSSSSSHSSSSSCTAQYYRVIPFEVSNCSCARSPEGTSESISGTINGYIYDKHIGDELIVPSPVTITAYTSSDCTGTGTTADPEHNCDVSWVGDICTVTIANGSEQIFFYGSAEADPNGGTFRIYSDISSCDYEVFPDLEYGVICYGGYVDVTPYCTTPPILTCPHTTHGVCCDTYTLTLAGGTSLDATYSATYDGVDESEWDDVSGEHYATIQCGQVNTELGVFSDSGPTYWVIIFAAFADVTLGCHVMFTAPFTTVCPPTNPLAWTLVFNDCSGSPSIAVIDGCVDCHTTCLLNEPGVATSLAITIPLDICGYECLGGVQVVTRDPETDIDCQYVNADDECYGGLVLYYDYSTCHYVIHVSISPVPPDANWTSPTLLGTYTLQDSDSGLETCTWPSTLTVS